MTIIPTARSTWTKWLRGDGSRAPTTNPGSHKPWRKSGVLGIDDMPAVELVSQISESNTGAQNRAQIIAELDYLEGIGKGTLLLPDGIFDYAEGSANPYETGPNASLYCFGARTNINLVAKNGNCYFRWEDDALSDDYRLDMLLVAGVSGVTIRGLKFIGNRDGNSSLYSQGFGGASAAGAMIRIGSDTGAILPGTPGSSERIRLADLEFQDTWWYGLSMVSVEDGRLDNIDYRDCGGGGEFIYCSDVRIRNMNNYVTNTSHASDDPIEIASCDDVQWHEGHVDGHTIGSALDLASSNVIISGVAFDGGNVNGGGPVIQARGANHLLPNADEVLFTNCMARNFSYSGQAGLRILVNDHSLVEPTELCRIRVSNFHAINCHTGIAVNGQPPNRGIGDIRIIGSTSERHTAYGLSVKRVATVRVEGGSFSDGLTGSRGIYVNSATDTALGHTRVEMDSVVAVNNSDFGVMIEQGATYAPQGWIHASCARSASNNVGYFGAPTLGAEFYCEYPAATGLELTNIGSPRTIALAGTDVSVTGDRFIFVNQSAITFLRWGKHNQTLDLFFLVSCTVDDVSQGGTRNITLLAGAQTVFAANTCIRLRYSATTQLWYQFVI